LHPVIFHLGPFALRSFGLAIAVGFAVAIAAVLRRAKRWGFPPDPVLNLCFYLIFSGILGARLAYVVTHLEEFAGRWLDAVNPFAGEQFGLAGLNLYGGIVVGIVVSVAYARRRNLPVLGVLDLLAPGVAIGLFVSRWGCFFNGCCFGRPTDLPWGVSFPPDTLPYYVFGPQPLHPTQIYSSLYGLVLFGVVLWVDERKKYFGWTAAWFLILEAIFRVAIEPLRYYEGAMHVMVFGRDFTYNELTSALLLATGVFLLVFLPRFGEKAQFLRMTFGRH
jgi:phosphatidylglycerol---prolipoprotein diacylglyceryl transferase